MAEAPKKDDKPAVTSADTASGTPIEPGLLAAIPRVAKQGGKLAESVNGKLAVRVATGYDRLAGLHQQFGRVLASLRAASTAAKEKH